MMGNRYGRKQKRAHREMILDLACTNRMLVGRVNDQIAERNKARAEASFLLGVMRRWDEEIRGMLGPYTSLAVEAPTFRVDHPDQIRQMPVMPPAPSFLFAGDVAADSISYYVETMLSLVAGLNEQDLMRMRRLLTLRVLVGNEARGSAYYAVSEETWVQLKREGGAALNRLVYRVADDLVRLIASPPKKPQGDDLFPPPLRSANGR